MARKSIMHFGRQVTGRMGITTTNSSATENRPTASKFRINLKFLTGMMPIWKIKNVMSKSIELLIDQMTKRYPNAQFKGSLPIFS